MNINCNHQHQTTWQVFYIIFIYKLPSNISVVFYTLHPWILYFIFLEPPTALPPTIYPWKVKTTNSNPHHNLNRDCGGSKYLCRVYIRPADNFKSHPRKVSVLMYADHINANVHPPHHHSFIRSDKLLMEIMNAQPEPLPQTYSSMRGNNTCMSG